MDTPEIGLFPCQILIGLWLEKQRGEEGDSTLKALAERLGCSYSYIRKLNKKKAAASDSFVVQLAQIVLEEPTKIRSFLSEYNPSALRYYHSIESTNTGLITILSRLGFPHLNCILDIVLTAECKAEVKFFNEKYGPRVVPVLEDLEQNNIISRSGDIYTIASGHPHSEVISSEPFILMMIEYLLKSTAPGMPGNEFSCRIGTLNQTGYEKLVSTVKNFRNDLAGIFGADEYQGEIKVGASVLMTQV